MVGVYSVPLGKGGSEFTGGWARFSICELRWLLRAKFLSSPARG